MASRRIRPSNTASSKSKPKGKPYGALAGDSFQLLPLTEDLSDKLYGRPISENLDVDLGKEASEYRKKYALVHSIETIAIESSSSRRPQNTPSRTTTDRQPLKRPDFKRREPVSEYKLVGDKQVRKAQKITVDQLEARYPGEHVPKTAIRTDMDSIPTMDISMKKPKHKKPDVVKTPELIKPFARGQQNIMFLTDKEFLRRFKLNKEDKPGGFDIKQLKEYARTLGLNTQLSKKQLITSISSFILTNTI